MLLGIEIGGTKLQFGVADGTRSEIVELRRLDVVPEAGADGILRQIAATVGELKQAYDISRIGYGFGGPIDSVRGRVQTSHQISGWDGLPLVEWTTTRFGVPTRLGNDCDCAALAEAGRGAGRNCASVFYVTVGTGVGGGFVIDGAVHGAARPAAAEIGHLRPGVQAQDSHDTVESIASGWGIAASARAILRGDADHPPHRLLSPFAEFPAEDREQLTGMAQGRLEHLTTKQLGEAARDGNSLARRVIADACDVLGWAVAQVVTLLAPEIVVIGGGVSLMGEELFFQPVREAFRRYAFPPLGGSCEIVPAALGEDVVVYGAIALAADR